MDEKKFKEYNDFNIYDISKEILRFWKDNKIFEKSISEKDPDKSFIFYEGPPSANGKPGIHHVMARTIKDIFCRYKTLKGYRVLRKAGWDTHGLPIELSVEKELGITKEDIGRKISIEDYNKECKSSVMKYTDIWNDLTEKIGYWVDMENPYVTYNSKYIESVWWILSEFYRKGLLYKGYSIQPYSPKAGTGLSSHEINQPGCYKDITDTTIIAQFKAINNSLPDFLKKINEDIFFLAWTTTPWTLPSNTALTIGKNIDYALIKTYNQYTGTPVNIILANNLASNVLSGKYFQVENKNELNNYNINDKKIPFYTICKFKGNAILESRYEQLLPYTLPYETPQKAFRVISGDFVTTEDGTGIVHTAPTFGADDAKVAKEAGVPPMLIKDENGNIVPLVDLQGKFVKEMKEFGGDYVKNEYYDEGKEPEKSVDVRIAIKLKEENRAFKVEKYTHSYPHCWRTDKPILYYPLDSWFIKVESIKDKLVNLNKKINWKPKSTGEGRFANWLENANDWNLSRSRYWGIPLPIWRTIDKKEEKIISSVEVLIKEIKKSIDKGFMKENPFKDFIIGNMSDNNYNEIDLHKNIVDNIILVSENGKEMKREMDLIDVWFDSGAMPYAQLHYPFENKELIDDNKYFPADFIAEGVDQTRGWFYTLHVISGVIKDNVAYKNVISNGLVLDKNGQKMSKRLGNTIEPFETIEKYSPDATRWYMISNSQPWDNLKFDIEGLEEVKRKFFGTLYNTYSFFSLYANLDNFTYSENDLDLEKRPELDRWILSELNTLIKKCEESYENYEPTKVARDIMYFVDEYLSNWFVRLSRRRYWKTEKGDDKTSAYQTLYTCLINISKLASPIAPFFMEFLYKNLNDNIKKEKYISVHLSPFPKANDKIIDKEIERKMQTAKNITSIVLALRKKENIKVRQPLNKIIIPILNEKIKQDILDIENLIKMEVNVKNIELLDDHSILIKNIKPNFKNLGPKYGQKMKLIADAINNFSKEDISEIENNNNKVIKIKDEYINITLEDVEISTKDIEGWSVNTNYGITVALDINITEELKNEGIARELVNRIQNIRKEKKFNLSDKINITLLQNTILETSIMEQKEYLCRETLSVNIVFTKNINDNFLDLNVYDINSKILVEKYI